MSGNLPSLENGTQQSLIFYSCPLQINKFANAESDWNFVLFFFSFSFEFNSTFLITGHNTTYYVDYCRSLFRSTHAKAFIADNYTVYFSPRTVRF